MWFSPEGDSLKDFLKVYQESSEESYWEGRIIQTDGSITVKSFFWEGRAGNFTWDGLDDNGGPKYKTWNIERIYDRLKKPLNVTEEELDSLNKISMIFGILTTDLIRQFTVFEGPIDSFFMSNTIGLTGVKKQIVDFDEIRLD